jgi:transposase InsO family protein
LLRRELVPELMLRFGCNQRNAMRVITLSPGTFFYKSIKKDETALTMRIKELSATRMHYGSRRVHVLLRREGHKDNVKRVYRIYKEQGLSLRLKRPRRNKAAKLRQPKQLAHTMNEIWRSLKLRCCRFCQAALSISSVTAWSGIRFDFKGNAGPLSAAFAALKACVGMVARFKPTSGRQSL